MDLNNPWCQVALAISIAGTVPPVVMSILKVLRQPEIQAAGRWIVMVAHRAWAAIQAAMTVPDARRHRPIADMAYRLGECTLCYMYALTFTAWFAFALLLMAERWDSLTPRQYMLFVVYSAVMSLLVRFYAERGRRIRVDLRRRWNAIRRRRWQTAIALACVPMGIALIAVGTELLRSSNAVA